MTQFEFIAIVISVILGLSIAKLVSGIGDSIRAIKAGSFYWIHGVWIINILILVAGFWWGMFGWSIKEDWNFFNFLLILLFTINLYLLSDFLIPKKSISEVDIKAYFSENRKMFFTLLLFTFFVDIIETTLLARTGIRSMPRGYFVVIGLQMSLSFIGYFSKNQKIQGTIVILWILILVSYVAYSILALGT